MSITCNYLEVLALEPADMQWAHYFANRKMFVHSDNLAAYAIINKDSFKDEGVMKSLRRVFWLPAIYNFRLEAVYCKGSYYDLADCASRLHEKDTRLLNVFTDY